MAVQLTNVRYSEGSAEKYEKGSADSAYESKGSVMVSRCFGGDENNKSLKWKDLDKLKIIQGNVCNVYIMNEKDKSDQKIEFGNSFEGFPTMTLLAMILVNEWNLRDGEGPNDGGELIKALEEYRNKWDKNKEQKKSGVWFIVGDGSEWNKADKTFLKKEEIDILSNGNFNSWSGNTTVLAGVDWQQFQKDLKNGTTENTPETKFRNNGSSGNSTLAYINFSEGTS